MNSNLGTLLGKENHVFSLIQIYDLYQYFPNQSNQCFLINVFFFFLQGSKSKDDVLIYEGPLVSKIRLAKLFSLSSSMIGLALQPMLYQKTVEAGTGLAVTIGGAVFLGFFTFVTPVLLHLISRKYVTHLLYNSYTEEFTAFTYNIFLFPVEVSYVMNLKLVVHELQTSMSFYANSKFCLI